MDGYIKLFRSLLGWEWWDDQNTTRLWLSILLSASFRETSWHGVTIQPGQLITSFSSLAKISGLSVQSIRTSLNRLKSTGEITIESTSFYTVVTIANWSKFQIDDDVPTSESTEKVTNDQQAPNKTSTSDQQHRKKVKKVKNNNTADFDAFWSAYPRKVGKAAALKSFAKVNVDIDKVLSAIEAQKQTDQWKRDGGQFIPYPSTWLNQGRWEDEIQQNQTKTNDMGF